MLVWCISAQDRKTLRHLFGPYSTPGRFYPYQVVDRPIYAEVIITAKTSDQRVEDFDRGLNESKTRLMAGNETRPADVLASPYIDEVIKTIIIA